MPSMERSISPTLVHKHQEQIFKTLKENYRKIIPAFGALALSHIRTKQMKDDEEDSLFSDLADQWVHTEGLKRSKLISDTSEADVLDTISSGMIDGLGTTAIASSIADLTDLSPWHPKQLPVQRRTPPPTMPEPRASATHKTNWA